MKAKTIIKGYLIIKLWALLFLVPSCVHKANVAPREKALLQILVLDQDTNKPVQNVLVILVNLRPGKGPYEMAYKKEIFSDYVPLESNGLFKYNAAKANGKEIWFLAPGYKSVPIEYSYLTKKEAPVLKVVSYYLIKTKEPHFSSLGFLLGILQATTIKYEFEKNLVIVPLKLIKDNPDHWEAELNVGLYALKSKIGVRALLILNDFVAHEKLEIEKKKKVKP